MPRYYQVWTALTAVTLIGPGAAWGFPGFLLSLFGGLCLSLGWQGLQGTIYAAIKTDQLLWPRIRAIIWTPYPLALFVFGMLIWGALWGTLIWRLIAMFYR